MIEICDIQKCTGCMVCYNVCNNRAISMIPDNEGFLRPNIDASLCVNCGLCNKLCPVVAEPNRFPTTKNVYSGWSLDNDTRLSSSSGGAFTEIANWVLDRGGVVFGCALSNNLTAQHIYVENKEELTLLKQSKYVQSNIGKSYKEAKRFLDLNRLVLYSGTPCQIGGLKVFLRKNYENLITVDIICHGVPSPMVFEDYKYWLMQKNQIEKIENIKFRDKKFSWFNFNMSISWNNQNGEEQTYIGTYYKDAYIRGFLRDFFLRPSCHSCQYTSTSRVGDFTIADWWGYKRNSKMDKDFLAKGVSLIMANSEKAMKIIPQLNMYLINRSMEEALTTNPCLQHPFEVPENRKAFWDFYKGHSFDEVVKEFLQPEKISLVQKILDENYNSDKLIYAIKPLNLAYRIKIKISKLIGSL